MPHKITPLEVRFWAKVDKLGEDECWPWKASLTAAGYGQIQHPRLGRPVVANRVSWELANGRVIPDGLMVCHRCDNPPCVNPKHLFLGTMLDNQRDSIAKGRHTAPPRFLGTKHHSAKLTDDQVAAIRTDRRPQRVIAKDYGLSQATVWAVRNWKTWTHLASAQECQDRVSVG